MGHQSYERPTKKAEIHLMEEEFEEVERAPIFDEDEREHEEEYYEGDCDAESLVIRRVIIVQEDEQWLRHNIFRTYCLSHGKKCLFMMDIRRCENMVLKVMAEKLKLSC